MRVILVLYNTMKTNRTGDNDDVDSNGTSALSFDISSKV